MGDIRRGRRVLVFIAVVVGLLTGFQAGAQTPGGEIVAFTAGPGGLAWRPLIPYEHGVLTVAGPDGVLFREEFGRAGASRTIPSPSRARAPRTGHTSGSSG